MDMVSNFSNRVHEQLTLLQDVEEQEEMWAAEREIEGGHDMVNGKDPNVGAPGLAPSTTEAINDATMEIQLQQMEEGPKEGVRIVRSGEAEAVMVENGNGNDNDDKSESVSSKETEGFDINASARKTVDKAARPQDNEDGEWKEKQTPRKKVVNKEKVVQQRDMEKRELRVAKGCLSLGAHDEESQW